MSWAKNDGLGSYDVCLDQNIGVLGSYDVCRDDFLYSKVAIMCVHTAILRTHFAYNHFHGLTKLQSNKHKTYKVNSFRCKLNKYYSSFLSALKITWK